MIIIAQFLNYFKDSHQIFTQHQLVENTGLGAVAQSKKTIMRNSLPSRTLLSMKHKKKQNVLNALWETYTNFWWILVQKVLIFNWKVRKGPMLVMASGWTWIVCCRRTCRCWEHASRETRAQKSQFSSKSN